MLAQGENAGSTGVETPMAAAESCGSASATDRTKPRYHAQARGPLVECASDNCGAIVFGSGHCVECESAQVSPLAKRAR